MSINYRKRIKVAPGVYMNISKSGVSTTIGVRGASVNFGKNGTYVNTGIPGTGFYSREKVGGGIPMSIGAGHSGCSYKGLGLFFLILAVSLSIGALVLDAAVLWAIAAFALLIAAACFKSTVSDKGEKSVEHDYLGEAKTLVDCETDEQKKRILQNFISSYELCDQIDDEERIIERLENKRETDKTIRLIEKHKQIAKELNDTLKLSQYDVDSELTPWERRRYERLCSAFETLMTTQRVWRIAGRSLNAGNKLSSAISLTREEGRLQAGVFDYMKSSFDVPAIQCGDKWLHLYPKFAVLAKTATDFTVASYDSVQFRGETTVFLENSLTDIPSEARRMGNTWRHVNKDGQPDRRFADNSMLYKVEYGYLQIVVGKETYDFHISNTSKLADFLYAVYYYSFNSYWKPENASVEDFAMFVNSFKPTSQVRAEYMDVLSTYFEQVNEEIEHLYHVVEKMNRDTTIVKEIERHCKINKDQNVSINFGEFSTALMLLVIRDMVYICEGLCKTYDFDNTKGIGLAVFFHRFFNRENISGLNNVVAFMNNGRDFADEYYKWYKSIISMEYEPYRLVVVDVLCADGIESELVSEYKCSLYNASYTIAKVGRDSPDTEDETLLNRIFNNNDAMEIQEQQSSDIDETTLDDIEQALPILLGETSVSASKFQRALCIGYARAVRIIEALEDFGVVSFANDGGFGHSVLVKDEKSIRERIELFKKHDADKRTDTDVSMSDEECTASPKPKDELNALVGLQRVKNEISNIYNLIKLQNIRKAQGMQLTSISYHCVFTGNPGTGKTTVARLVAQIYKELGILKKGQLVETDRSGLVAEYIGQTAVKTNKIIDSALDGVLFIDEAYSLVQGGNNDYGMEAISTLLKRMEDDRDRIVVILAGYTDEMKLFIDSNPGLQSRFNRYIHFDDYSADELVAIYKSYLTKCDYVLSSEAKSKLQTIVGKAVSEKDCNFGNARYVRNLFEKTLENQARRLASGTSLTREALSEIKEEDIPDV